MKTTRIILADDHRILAEALASLLKESFDLVGIVRDGRALIDEVLRLEPDVVVSDIFMPLLNGLDALRYLRSKGNQTKVVFLTVRTDVPHATEAFRAGASGFVSKESAGEELIHAITEVVHDRLYVTPLVGKDLLSILMDARSQPSTLDLPLTNRQREVLQLLAEGKTIKEAAAILGISPRTVESHKYEMMELLGIKTTADLIRWAFRLKLISPQDIQNLDE
jgi:DNA-binding NarL/FixJ family response regulator